jgi:hypothetical protein
MIAWEGKEKSWFARSGKKDVQLRPASGKSLQLIDFLKFIPWLELWVVLGSRKGFFFKMFH